MDLKRYKTEMDKLRARTKDLNGTSPDLRRRIEKEQGTERALEHLETLCLRNGEGLDDMSFEERQDLLRLVVDNIIVENGTVRIDTIIPSGDDMGQLRTRRGEAVEPPAAHQNDLPKRSFDRLRMSDIGRRSLQSSFRQAGIHSATTVSVTNRLVEKSKLPIPWVSAFSGLTGGNGGLSGFHPSADGWNERWGVMG